MPASRYLRKFPEPRPDQELRRLEVIDRHRLHNKFLADDRVISMMNDVIGRQLRCPCFYITLSTHRVWMFVYASFSPAPEHGFTALPDGTELGNARATMWTVPRRCVPCAGCVGMGKRMCRAGPNDVRHNEAFDIGYLDAREPGDEDLLPAFAKTDVHSRVLSQRLGWLMDPASTFDSYPDYPAFEEWGVPADLPAQRMAYCHTGPFARCNDERSLKAFMPYFSPAMGDLIRFNATATVRLEGCDIGAICAETPEDRPDWGEAEWAALEKLAADIARHWTTLPEGTEHGRLTPAFLAEVGRQEELPGQ